MKYTNTIAAIKRGDLDELSKVYPTVNKKYHGLYRKLAIEHDQVDIFEYLLYMDGHECINISEKDEVEEIRIAIRNKSIIFCELLIMTVNYYFENLLQDLCHNLSDIEFLLDNVSSLKYHRPLIAHILLNKIKATDTDAITIEKFKEFLEKYKIKYISRRKHFTNCTFPKVIEVLETLK
jgi:hypothetical protein